MTRAATASSERFLPDELPSLWAWRTSELRLLDANYARLGAAGCRALLPNRTHGAIRERASARGLRFTPPGKD